jgi:hypothetical protein
MRHSSIALLLALAVWPASCSGVAKTEYEYEEELYLSLDGSATLYVNASLAALVALHGIDLDIDPRARFDPDGVRTAFAGPDVRVSGPTTSRRNGRRFVHVRVDAPDIGNLQQVPLFSWSSYSLGPRGDVLEYRQRVGSARGKPVRDVGWTGDEVVAFRMHVPSKIPFHNARDGVQRGNILAWEQPLRDRINSVPIDIQAQMENRSILSRTLLLFASTIVAAAGAFAVVVWWIARQGRSSAIAETGP